MKFRHFMCIILALVVVSSMLIPAYADEATASDPSVTLGPQSLDGQMPVMSSNKIVDNVKTALMYEVKSGTLIYTYNADEKIYPASFVKILTALIAIENGNLADEITATKQTLATIPSNAVSVGIKPEEVMTLEQLLYCLLVYSANDAAAVIAEYISGSQGEFVALMNTYAQQLGCTATTICNPHGLHDENQVSTARDVGRMLEAALKNDTFKKIFTTTHYTIAETNLHNERTISAYNNYLINKDNVSAYYDARVKGSRMAVDNYGYRNIASYAESGNMQVICIVTGTKSTLADNGTTQVFGGFLETTALLNKCFEKYNTYQFTYSDQVLQQKTVINGDSDVYLTSEKSLSAVLPRGTSLDDLTFRYSDLEDSNNAPVKKGDVLGSLSVWYGSSCVGYTELIAMNDVPLAYAKVIFPEKQKQGFPWWGIALIAVGCFAVLGVCVVIILRIRSTVRHKKANKRHRREKTNAPMG